MSASTVGLFLRHLALSKEVSLLSTASDGDLLASYDPEQGQAAFTELVRRYGPMVLRTCRRVLGHSPDAEDAFQATFVLLARQAGQLCREAAVPLSLGGWLHRVAHRTALNVLSQSARRRTRERQASVMNQPDPDPVVEATWNEVLPILDAELEALPDESRRLLIACYLQGKTHSEAATELGLPLGSVARRLDKARALLADRLTRRGITVSGTLLAVLLGEAAKGAGVPAVLLVHTVEAARRFTELAAQVVSDKVFRLVQEGLTQMAGNGSAHFCLAIAGWVALLGAGLIACQTCTILPEQKPQSDSPAALASQGQTQEKDKQVCLDHYGDPIPPGALARLGTIRLRNADTGRTSVFFTPDGKGVITAGNSHASLWEIPGGKLIHPFGDQSRYGIEAAAVSPDGCLLAGRGGADGSLRLWNLDTGKLVAECEGEPTALVTVAFSPDGKRVVSGGSDKKLWLWDAATGQKLWVRNVGHVGPLSFSRDGKTIVALDEHGFSLWDAATGERKKERWNSTRPLLFDAAFSSDGSTLAVTCGSQSQGKGREGIVCLVDVPTLKEVRQLAPEDQERSTASAFQALALAADGKILATANGLGEVRLWDTDTGKELRRCQGGRCFANSLAFSADGKTLAGVDGGYVRLWETATGKEISSAQGGHKRGVSSVAFSPGGDTLVSNSGDGSVRLWDTHTGAQRKHISPARSDWEDYQLAGEASIISPDGKTIIVADLAWPIKGGAFGGVLQVWDLEGDRERSRFFRKLGTQLGNSLVLSPDGKTAASTSTDGPEGVQLLESATGKLLSRFAGSNPTFSSDGKLLATYSAELNKSGSAMLWDTATAKQLGSISIPEGSIYRLAFSPQGKMLATLSNVAGGHNNTNLLRLWPLCPDESKKPGTGLSAGSPRVIVEGIPPSVLTVAFSPDGRTLALPDQGGAVRVLETATGKERMRFVGHGGEVRALAFSPDGRRLASGSLDTTILVWDATGRLQNGRLRPEHLSIKEIEELGADLAADDAQRAGRAIWALVAAPAQAVPFLAKLLQPASNHVVPEVITCLIRDLDNDAFEVRVKSRNELQKLGDLAEPALRQALRKMPPLEMRKRLEELLAEVEVQRKSPFGDALRGLRAVEVLEQIGNHEARQVLTKLASGAPQSVLTQEAASSVERLERAKTR